MNPHHQRRWLILGVIGLAQLMVVLDATIVNIALPSAQQDLGFGDDSRQWIVTGFGHSGRVVTAAAIIMIAVFGAFILDPDPILKSIGLSLAFGVLADAFLVRLTLVPAVMALLGRAAWWLPRRIDRIVPRIDVEGARA